jgi:phospholipase C
MKAQPNASWRQQLAALGAGTILATGIATPSIAASHDDFSTKTPIKHIVIIFPENESFDHYFGTYPFAANPPGEPRFIARDDTPSANNLLAGGLLTDNPNLFQPFRLDRLEAFSCSLDHGYTDEQKAFNGGLMDKFVQATARLGFGCRGDGSSVMGYFDGNTVTALWNYAQHFAMSDNSFTSTYGPSSPGALNLISGMTGNAHQALSFGGGQVATFNPTTVTGDPDPALDDCGADKGGTVTGRGTIEMQGRNVGDLLSAKGVSWGWFQGGFAPTSPAVLNPDGSTKTPAVCGSQHTGHPGVPNPTALNGQTNPPTDIHVPITDYNPHHQPFQYYVSTRNPHHVRPASIAEVGHDGPANHQYDLSDFFDALKAHRLPAVSYIKPANYQDEHPSNSDPLSFQTFLVDVLNALQQSPEWKDTAVIVNWDDTDGWYDHVAGPAVSQSADAQDSLIPVLPLSTSTAPAQPGLIPTSGSCGGAGGSAAAPRCGYGMRVPFLVISPWAKNNFVDHTLIDQSSSLAFVEQNWHLDSIDPSPLPVNQGGSFDRIAGSILNMFDFDDAPNLGPLVLDDLTGLVVRNHRDKGRDRD